jgi:hypothetical protein
MTKNFLPIALGLVAISSLIRDDDITLTDGTMLKNAKIVQRDDATKTVTISFSGGTAKVPSEMMPTSIATTTPPAAVTQPAPAPPPTVSPDNTPMPKDWTVNGREFYNVTVGEVEADRVNITYDGGLGTVMLADMPRDLQKRFNYDPAAAQKLEAQRAADQQEFAALDAARAKEQATQAAATRLANRPKVYRMGEVIQRIPGGGLLIDCEMPEPVADSSASVGGGGGVYVPQTGCPAGMKMAYGTFRLTGYPNENTVVDGEAVRTVAFEDGTFSYTSVAGSYKTVTSYEAVAR